MSEQPEGHPAPDHQVPPEPAEQPVAGGGDDGPPAQGEGEPDSY